MATKTKEPPEAPLEWRSIPTEDLGLVRDVQSALYSRGADTLGRLSDKLDAGETFNLDAGVLLSIRNSIERAIEGDEKEAEREEPDGDAKAWRLIAVADLELDEAGDTAKALAAAKLITLGQVANEFEAHKGKPILGLGVDDSEKLADLINMAAELDEDFEEIVIGYADDEADAEPKTWRDVAYDPTTTEGLIAYDEQTRRILDEDAEEVGELEAEFDRLHKLAAGAKKSFESARDGLIYTLRERKDGRTKKPQPTLLDKPIEPKEKVTPSALDDLWQQFPISFERWGRFGLTEKDVEKLNGGETKNHGPHPIGVMGDMTRFITPTPSNPTYARKLSDFKGFGAAGADRWAEAETKFWAWWKNGGQEEFAREKGLIEAAAKIEEASGEGVTVTVGEQADADDSRPLSDAAEKFPEIPDAGKRPKRKPRAK